MYVLVASFLEGRGSCLLDMSMIMTDDHSLLLWWTLDSVSLPVIIKPKAVKEALQWRSKLRVQVQSHVNQSEITSEFNLQCNYSLVLNGTFVRRTGNLEKTVTWTEIHFSLSVTTHADAFLCKGNIWGHDQLSTLWHNTRKKHTSQESNTYISPKFPQKPKFIVIINAWTGNANSSLWIRNVMYRDFRTIPRNRLRNTYQTQ